MGPSVLVFVMTGCGACEEFKPRMMRAARGLPIRFFDVSQSQQASDLMDAMNLESTPTSLIVRNGQVLAVQTGAMSDSDLEQFLAPVKAAYQVPATQKR